MIIRHVRRGLRSFRPLSPLLSPFSTTPKSPIPEKDEEKEKDGEEKKEESSWLPPLDEETQREKDRQHKILMQKLTRSKWSDAVRSSTDKLFLAEEAFLPAEEEFLFPSGDIEVSHLWPEESGVSGKQKLSEVLITGRPTILTLSFQQLGRTQLAPVHNAVVEEFASLGSAVPLVVGGVEERSSENVGLSLVDLNYVEGMPYWALQWILKRGMRDAIEPPVRPFSFVTFQAFPQPAEAMCFDAKIHNRVMGHTFLLDHKGVVRWSMHADPHPQELQALISLSKKLVQQTK